MPTTKSKSSVESTTTTDHKFIREWVEERGGTPACVKGTGGRKDPGMIRIDFPGWSGEDSLEPISWDEWFKAFDDNKLAFLYQDTTKDGEESRFNKLVSRGTASRSRSTTSRSRSTTSSASGSHAKTSTRTRSSSSSSGSSSSKASTTSRKRASS